MVYRPTLFGFAWRKVATENVFIFALHVFQCTFCKYNVLFFQQLTIMLSM